LKIKVLLITILLIGTLFPTISASNTFTFEEELTAGCSLTYEITLENEGNQDTTCSMETEITPDDNGITVSFSEDEFEIKKQSSYNLTIYVNTSMLLEPDLYHITVTFLTDKGEVVTKKGRRGSGCGDDDDDDTEPLEDDDDDDNDTEPILDDDDDDDDVWVPPESKDESFNWFIFGGVLIGLFAFLILLLILVKRRNKGVKK